MISRVVWKTYPKNEARSFLSNGNQTLNSQYTGFWINTRVQNIDVLNVWAVLVRVFLPLGGGDSMPRVIKIVNGFE
jgi:hypothetical protein